MAIELSDIIFTDQADIVPAFGVEEIVNTGHANTLAGNDIITGTGGNVGIANWEEATFNTGDGNDVITGEGTSSGILISSSILDTGKGDDVITGISTGTGGGILLFSALFNTGDGNDTINGAGNGTGIINTAGSTLDTGKGNDIIQVVGVLGISNYGAIITGSGKDSIVINSESPIDFYALDNYGIIETGDDDDIILSGGVIDNHGGINTGEGNDTILSSGAIDNHGGINTGNGNDIIIAGGGVNGTGTGYGIYNNGSRIETGDGNDTIIAYDGFKSAPNSSGAWYLGESDDYIKGFGSGDFYGGNGNDTLELTPGTYTVEIWGEAGESPIFKKGGQVMITSEFETLIAGATTYNFASLTAGQIITVS